MAVEIFMPKLGMSMKEGTVVEWLKKKGDKVKKGESVVVISSDKIETDIEAPQDGVLLEILVEQDETVEVGKVIGYIGQEGEEAGDQSNEAPQETPQQAMQEVAVSVGTIEPKSILRQTSRHMLRVSPAARKLAREAGIDLSNIKGSGPKGRITKADVEKAIQLKQASLQPVSEKQMIEETGQITIAETIQITTEQKGVTVKPVTGMRKVIATRMFASLQQTAQLTIHMKADVTELLELQKKLREELQDEPDIKLTITDFIARATVLALCAHKQMNSLYQNGNIHTYDSVHLGIAVALENGLVVPVIPYAEKLSLKEISKKIKELSVRAREGKLSSEEMKGSTFTITSLGAYGVEFFTPVLNPPEVGILGVGTVTDTPVFVGDAIQKRKILPLSLTFDHQVIDGAPASQFLTTIKNYLEKPYKMLL
ncbi:MULTISPECIES: dihydrolipoamide acetyltransferase family protein [unclassified Geobacillus]|uniref:dihydrolipoamide acetyltransferase family protein n=1 Tax=unclassified Geobacillus TaxID=2642459 RepID=UPI000BE36A34|nr:MULTISPECIES: dihydrolipoamide acetyltransferase family protein [unclassified Geobacillus]PDM40503.1 branched-chain alpha-keto acid dehydrogenase subunit E2 [Parageobacillus yumthangensis]RDV23156.1 2-oxo acid dehydrogenase subunit E2 [Parageobacillus toebii]TXK91021.1 2-oxo acid dehydrogenase subunit E2 [Parageobacillus sp. SY1]PUF89137.1 2-oxo acid dehydrogenase subunit E2 [Geobacillus sp. LYN3]TXK87577.1 2-oxo acid dehydrogenase subunit E2 [Geobacillus sp. AYS3]